MNVDKKDGFFYLVLFIGTIFLANYLISHVGVTCDHGPCIIPVWPGIMAPSGVLAVGLGFTLRDLVQRRLGVGYTILGIVIGAVISGFLSPGLAMASGGAFLLSEMLDLFVYTPLQQRHLFWAMIGSNIVGLIADSVVFLWLAFGSLMFLEGQIIGKLWMTLLAIPVIYLIRKWDKRRGLVVVTG